MVGYGVYKASTGVAPVALRKSTVILRLGLSMQHFIEYWILSSAEKRVRLRVLSREVDFCRVASRCIAHWQRFLF